MLGACPLQTQGYTSLATVFSFPAARLFPDTRLWTVYHSVFTFCTAMVAIGTVFMYFFLPETYGMTLEEIEGLFRSGDKPAGGGKEAECAGGM
jgi:hypothetical protein